MDAAPDLNSGGTGGGGGSAPAASPWRPRPDWLVAFALVFFAVVYAYPLVRLVAWSFWAPGFTFRNFAQIVAEPAYLQAFYNTVEIAGIATAVCLALGYPLAYLMATTDPRPRMILGALILIPFWTSVLVRTLAWVVLLGRNGIINQALLAWGLVERPIPLVFNNIGVQIGMVHVLLPFMVLPLYAVMARIDPSLVTAARSLGASPARAFLAVFAPLSLPGVVAGASLVFLMALGFYVTPALLGGPNEITVATLIEIMVRDLLDWGSGAALGLLLLAGVASVFAAGAVYAGAGRLVGAERA
ncbi:MAG: ABC transporter permease [Proteobacteria bacterium]|nr:ABC transporter permease [Pseudomonadota bacterium]